MEQILADRPLAVCFRLFLHQHFNNENFSFWLEVDQYKKIVAPEDRAKRAKEIHEKYFSPNSKYELNLEAEIKKELLQNINYPTETLFDNAQKAIYKILETDCIPQFYQSTMYKEYKEGKAPRKNSPLKEKDKGETLNLIKNYKLDNK